MIVRTVLAAAAAVLVSFTLVLVTTGTRTVAQNGLLQACASMGDGSGTTTSDPETRAWFLQTLGVALGAIRSTEGVEKVSRIYLYGDKVVGLTVDLTAETDDDALREISELMQPGQWTDPLPAFLEAGGEAGARCLIHITDGSLDLPPHLQQNRAGYEADLLALADDLARAGIPVLTIALDDANNGIWSQIAARTGGAYLINPDNSDIRQEIQAMMLRSSSPTPTARSSPSPTLPTTSGTPTPPPSGPSVPIDGPPVSPASPPWTLVFTSVGIAVVTAATVGLLVNWWRAKPALSGTLEIYEREEGEE